MELIIKGTPKEIADLVVQVQGRPSLMLEMSNDEDIKTAAGAIHGIRPAILRQFASKGYGAEEALHPEDL